MLVERDVYNKLRLGGVLQGGVDVDIEVTSASALTMQAAGDGSLVQSRVNNCGLSVPSAVASMLQHWAHKKVGREHVDAWMQQFVRLGGKPWT